MKLSEEIDQFWTKELKVREITHGLERRIIHKLQKQVEIMRAALQFYAKGGPISAQLARETFEEVKAIENE